MNLQHHMDEQQEKHERLMVGRDWAEGLADKCRDRIELNAKLDNPFKSMKSYTTKERGFNIPGKGLTFYVSADYCDPAPRVGEVVLINGKEYKVNYLSGFRSEAHKTLSLEIGTIPAPQEPSDGPGGTKTPLEEEKPVKGKESPLGGLPNLERKTLDTLMAIAGKPDRWTHAMARINKLEDELEKARSRIAELEEAVRNLTPNRLGPKPMGSAEFWSDEET